MAGIYDRVANRGENDRPIGSLTAWACVYAVGRGIATGAQVAAKLDEQLGDQPLTGPEKADLNAILAHAQTGTATQRIDYMLRLQSILIATETGLIQSEATFRAELGI